MEFKVGEVLHGEVVALKPYGAFVRLPNGVVGMIHISEVAQEYVSDISQYLSVGEEVIVKVIGENAEGKPNLSLKRLSPQELEEARFHREVEEVRLALERRNGEVLARLRRQKRPKPSQEQETLRSWIAEVKRVLERLQASGTRPAGASHSRRGRGSD